MSTSMLVKKMQAAATATGVEAKIWAIAQSELPAHKSEAQIVLLGPQIRYALKDVIKEVGDDIPVQVIDVLDYGTMNGEKVLNKALGTLGLV